MEEKTYTKNDIMEALNRTKVIIVPEAVELETQDFAELCAGAESFAELCAGAMVTSLIEGLIHRAEPAEEKLKENG